MAKKSFAPQQALIDLPFDQFSRQHIAKKYVELNRSKRKIKILDIGGYKGKTGEFFPNDETTIIDLFDIKEPGYIKGSALDLPFEDNSFDCILSFDVFEHIEEKDRTRFLEEAFRVSADMVLLAAPFDTNHVADAEKELNDYYKLQNQKDHRWLQEHIENGLPSLVNTRAAFKKLSSDYTIQNSNPLWIWCLMQYLIFLADNVRSANLITDVNRFYNTHIDEIDGHGEESYRHIFFGRKNNEVKLPPDVSSAKSLNSIRLLINQTFISALQLVANNHTHNAMIASKDVEIRKLQLSMAGIYSSPSWRLATILRRIKSFLTFWR